MQDHDVPVKTYYMEDSLSSLQTEDFPMGPITEEQHLLNESFRSAVRKLRGAVGFKIILESHRR